jgi:hypothetical protein
MARKKTRIGKRELSAFSNINLTLKKEGKFKNVKMEIDGVVFHSKGEAQRYLELKKLEELGVIKELELQPKFKIFFGDTYICTYIADFKYISEGKEVVEDFKGVETGVFKLKAKMFKAVYPEYEFIITRARYKNA